MLCRSLSSYPANVIAVKPSGERESVFLEMLRKHIQRDNKLFATPIYEACLIHKSKNPYDRVLFTGIFLSQVGNISLLGAIHTSKRFDDADQLLRKLSPPFG